VLQTFRGTKKGKSLEMPGVSIMHMSGGKITEAWFIDQDPYTADAFYDA
jgi:ketosteroid isomerase-like protein